MTTLTKTIAATALSLTLAPLTLIQAHAADRVIVLSNTMETEDARQVLAESKRMLRGLQAGDTMTFIDGVTTEQVAQFAVPEGDEGTEILNSPRKFARHYGPKLKAVQDHLVASAKAAQSLPVDIVPMQVNVPGVLYSMSIIADQKPDIIFLGSLRYQDDDKMPGYSMLQSFPNDGHIGLTPSQSPFGAAGKDGILDGARVHFCDLDDGYLKTMQQHGLERATALLVQGYGATFATYSQNISECVRKAMTGHVDPTKTVTANPDDKEPRIYDVTMSGQLPASTSREQRDLYDRIQLPTAQKIELWEQMTSGNVQLAEVQLFDTQSTDGDVVALISGSVRIDVPLTKTAKTLIVPITNGALTMLGVRDGNGGITVGVRTKDGDELTSPVMRVGQTIELPFLSLAS